MDVELKTKWAAALRSGDYLQTQGKFRRAGSYCCLGVLCVVADQPVYSLGTFGNWPFVHKALSDEGRLAHDLAHKNDSGATFPEIADWIEANIPADPLPAPTGETA